jgi:hypothetical protein
MTASTVTPVSVGKMLRMPERLHAVLNVWVVIPFLVLLYIKLLPAYALTDIDVFVVFALMLHTRDPRDRMVEGLH